MYEISSNRERYGYGTAQARIVRDMSIPSPTGGLQFLNIVLGVLFLGSHISYRKRLQSTRPKENWVINDFRKLLQSFVVEWAGAPLNFLRSRYRLTPNARFEFTGQLVSLCGGLHMLTHSGMTVYCFRLVSANNVYLSATNACFVLQSKRCVFSIASKQLTANTIQTLTFKQGITDVQRVASQISTILSLLSIVTGLFHTWQHRPKFNVEYTEAASSPFCLDVK
jgi:hypothetical protein